MSRTRKHFSQPGVRGRNVLSLCQRAFTGRRKRERAEKAKPKQASKKEQALSPFALYVAEKEQKYLSKYNGDKLKDS